MKKAIEEEKNRKELERELDQAGMHIIKLYDPYIYRFHRNQKIGKANESR